MTQTLRLSALLVAGALCGVGCDAAAALPTAPTPTTPSVVQTEGRWTPVLGGHDGTSGQVYKSQHGEWVRTGNLVFASATITLAQKGTIVGTLEIQGLPFRSAPMHDSACVFGDFDSAGSPQVWVSGIIFSGVAYVELRHRDSPMHNMSSMDTHDVADTTALEMACTYITAGP